MAVDVAPDQFAILKIAPGIDGAVVFRGLFLTHDLARVSRVVIDPEVGYPVPIDVFDFDIFKLRGRNRPRALINRGDCDIAASRTRI